MTPTDEKPMTVEALMKIVEELRCSNYNHVPVQVKLLAAIRQYGGAQYARGATDGWAAGRGSGEPVAVEPIIDAYLDDYETAYDEGSSAPDADTKFVIKDAIMGLLADDEFVKAVTPQPREPLTLYGLHDVGA